MSDRSPPSPRPGVTVDDAAGLAEMVRALLDRKGVTHAAAAEAIGVKRPAVSRALSETSPGVPICRQLLEHYAGYTTDTLYRLRKLD
ncbi:helix-turn-helix domain-containing protein [Rubrivirga sp. IMCC43871]|uniref:helix-turn-helix domain-containing protein n=1 Tax=Rubrivirga sp. IMCC43871 TaxID=3391575 RepID=UPI00398FF2B9